MTKFMRKGHSSPTVTPTCLLVDGPFCRYLDRAIHKLGRCILVVEYVVVNDLIDQDSLSVESWKLP